MPTSPIVQLFLFLGVAACLLALWKGGPAERTGAAVILGTYVLGELSARFLPAGWAPILNLCGDGLTALGLLALTVRFASLWLGGAMLFYAAQFTLHSYYFVANRPDDRFHAVVNNLNVMGVILCLAVGTAVAWRKRVRARAQPCPVGAASG